ncbi:cytochrome P450 [Pluteus cervinus]|uniref:Cytochrome P450 n=1 Tax=Pluteus cervinus TaxID=181527 RepID=A0ACD3BB00_9AGAR|nr:cytochrome P450 [Pluteus cervinus]
MESLALSVLVVLLAFWLLRLARARLSKFPLPPGPPPRLIIGNLADLPTIKPWITYARWSKTYNSELIHVQALGQNIVIVNGLAAAIEVFEKRAHNFISRPELIMLRLMNWDWNLGLMPYGPRWARHRRIYESTLRKESVMKYEDIQTSKIQDLLQSILETPQHFLRHIQTLTAAFSMAAIYGYDIKSMEDPYVDLADKSVAMLSASIFPGALLVNAFPVLNRLPRWFPGTGFKSFAEECNALTTRMRDEPIANIKRRMAEGTAPACLAVKLFEEHSIKDSPEPVEEIVKDVTASTYAGAADTAHSAIRTAFYCLASHPEVVRKARAEIHHILGTGRLPLPSDQPLLPYLEAVFREVMRFYPAAPLVPRAALEDDVVGGYFIPKGTTVLSNLWAITHDPEMFEDPDEFRPERFLNPDGTLNNDSEDRIFAFGFGRRICPGRHLATSFVWTTIASVISVFDFHPARDEMGNEIPVKTEYTDGLVCHPKAFQCALVPYSKEATSLIDGSLHDVNESYSMGA